MARDEVRYRVPGGRLMNWLLVKNDLIRIFEFRRNRMLELFPPLNLQVSDHEVNL